MTKIKNIISIIFVAALVYLAFDFLGLLMWVESGQYPGGGYYFGVLSAKIIGFIVSLF